MTDKQRQADMKSVINIARECGATISSAPGQDDGIAFFSSELAAFAERIRAERWLPIATAPKDGTEVDVWCPEDGGGYRVANAWWSTPDSRWRCYGDESNQWAHQPTHYQSLPPPPAAIREPDQAGGEG